MKDSALKWLASPQAPTELDRERCERSVVRFTQQGWRYIDPTPYTHGWHIDAIAEHLEAVCRGELRRLLINIPPRHMKSLLCGVSWPAWVWAQDAERRKRDGWVHAGPGVRFVNVSYAQELATRDLVKSRRVIQSPWYQERWGDRFQFSGDQNRKTRVENTANGHRIAISADGSNTGEGGDIIIIDDPHNAKEAESDVVRKGVLTWFDEVMPSRLNDQRTGAFVIIMQRVHEEDLSGHLLAKDAGYTHLCLPVRRDDSLPTIWKRDPRAENGILWPERFTEESLVQLEADMGAYAFAGQYGQRPTPREGGMFKVDKIHIIDTTPDCFAWVRAWDLAGSEGSGDATAGVLIGRHANGYHIEHVEHFRKGPKGVKDRIKETAERDTRAVPIRLPQDPAQAGKAQALDFYVHLDGWPVTILPMNGDKETRAKPFASQVEGERVTLKRGTWNKPFLDELRNFPLGKHDDMVDAASDGYNSLICLPPQPRIRAL